jgi:hypothetical protein
VEQAAPERPRGSGVTAGWGTEPAGTTAQAAIDQAEAARQQLRNAASDASDRDADLDQQFQAILEGGGALYKPPAVEPTAAAHPVMPTPGITDDARWLTVFSIVAKSGPKGIGPTAIGEFFAKVSPGVPVPSRSAITDWFKAEPQIHQPASGKYALRPQENS